MFFQSAINYDVSVFHLIPFRCGRPCALHIKQSEQKMKIQTLSGN